MSVVPKKLFPVGSLQDPGEITGRVGEDPIIRGPDPSPPSDPSELNSVLCHFLLHERTVLRRLRGRSDEGGRTGEVFQKIIDMVSTQ